MMTTGRALRNLQCASVALAASISFAGVAHANRIAIDNSATPFSACAIAGPCLATPIPITANFGFGAFNSLYIYSNGLVSIGAQIAPGANLTSLSSIGGNVFTAGYAPGMTLANFQLQDPTPSATFDFPGRPVARVRYTASFGSVVDMPMGFSIFDLGSGAYALQFNHGDPFNLTNVPDIASNAYLGYSFGAASFQQSGAPLVSAVRSEATFRYFFPAPASTVPELSSWIMIITGFGLLGASVRRQSSARTRIAT
jgi:hypothetical protein